MSAVPENGDSPEDFPNSLGTASELENTDADAGTPYEIMEALIFGTDPGDWAAELLQRLLIASSRLENARTHQANPAREITDAIDAQALANVRQMAGEVLATLYEILAAMPIMQMTPRVLDGLHYVLTSIHDVERGSAPDWLIAKPTKAHPKTMDDQVDWKFIVASVQLLRLLPAFKTEDAAVNEIARRTKRSSGTIKRWCRKLHCPQRHEVPEAREWIETELMTFREALKLTLPENHQRVIDNQIRLLLP